MHQEKPQSETVKWKNDIQTEKLSLNVKNSYHSYIQGLTGKTKIKNSSHSYIPGSTVFHSQRS